MYSKVSVLLFLILISLAGSAALADQTAVIPASNDATLFGGADATTNQSSSGPGMFVGTDGTSAPKRGLIEFNIQSAIPAGSTITSASLTLHLGMVAGAGGGSSGTIATPRTISLFTVSDPWQSSTNGTTGVTSGFGGTGHGYSPNIGDPTWNYSAYNTVSWTSPGGDFSSTASASLTDPSTHWSTGEAYTWSSTSMLVQNVQSWLDGTTANYGWLLQNTDETDTQTFRAFYTAQGASEQNVPSYAPELTVTYVSAAPEPVAGALLIPAVLLCRRRTRCK
jgi:hypothetical protein